MWRESSHAVSVYDNLKEVVEVVKRRPKSLAAYIFSKDQVSIDYFLSRVFFGGGCVNQTNLHCWIGLAASVALTVSAAAGAQGPNAGHADPLKGYGGKDMQVLGAKTRLVATASSYVMEIQQSELDAMLSRGFAFNHHVMQGMPAYRALVSGPFQ